MKALLAATLTFVFGLSALADWDLEKRRIEFLISSVEQMDATFIRNSTEYSADQAAKHLQTKLKYVVSKADLNTFTAEDFIEQAASKSSLTGKAYQIQFKTGEIVAARDWLLHQLQFFN